MPLTFEPISVPLHMDETGTVRVSGTRVTLDTIIRSHQAGESPEELANNFSRVSLADIYTVIAYYHGHRTDVDAYLSQREREARAIRAKIESQPENVAFRELLRARRSQLEVERRAATGHG